MPIYDYICSDCKHRVEVIHGINAEGPRFCPNCGHEGTMRKALATPAIHFKGSGWAKKDRSSTSGARTKAGATSGSGSGSGEGSSSTAAAPDSARTSDGSASSSSSASSSGGSSSTSTTGSEG